MGVSKKEWAKANKAEKNKDFEGSLSRNSFTTPYGITIKGSCNDKN